MRKIVAALSYRTAMIGNMRIKVRTKERGDQVVAISRFGGSSTCEICCCEPYVMMRIQIVPSPCADVGLSSYEGSKFPKFKEILEKAGRENSGFWQLGLVPEEASVAVILENRSAKDITALRFGWAYEVESGEGDPREESYDSYRSHPFRSVVPAGSCQLIVPSGRLHDVVYPIEALGYVRSIADQSVPPTAIAVTFQIDFILFADGQMFGPDHGHFANELESRQAAANFVAQQIRLALAEHRDPAPVISALSDLPQLHSHPLESVVRDCARAFLRSTLRMEHRSSRVKSALWRLENLPTLPTFHRRDDASSSDGSAQAKQ
jgi:hypothetical protein